MVEPLFKPLPTPSCSRDFMDTIVVQKILFSIRFHVLDVLVPPHRNPGNSDTIGNMHQCIDLYDMLLYIWDSDTVLLLGPVFSTHAIPPLWVGASNVSSTSVWGLGREGGGRQHATYFFSPQKCSTMRPSTAHQKSPWRS